MCDARKPSFFWVFHSPRGLHSKVASFADEAEYLPSSCVFCWVINMMTVD